MFKIFVFLFSLYFTVNAFAGRNAVEVKTKDYNKILRFLIKKSNRKSSYCTAVLIKPGWALTAAHCFRNVSPKRYSTNIRVDQVGSKFKARVKNIHILDTFLSRELALVELYETVGPNQPWNRKRNQEVQFPENYDEIFELPSFFAPNLKFFQVGYGMGISQEPGQKLRRSDLQYSGQFYSRFSPVIVMKPIPKIDAHPCQGDSGSPLYMEFFGQNYLVGIISYIFKTDEVLSNREQDVICKKANRSVFIPISEHLEWIESTIAKSENPDREQVAQPNEDTITQLETTEVSENSDEEMLENPIDDGHSR